MRQGRPARVLPLARRRAGGPANSHRRHIWWVRRRALRGVANHHPGRSVFRHAALLCVAAGIGAECVSMVAFALLQRQLLDVGNPRLTLGALLGTSYVGNAITAAVPIAGSGLALAYTQRQFRARGADPATVSLALVVAGVISAVAFATFVAVGAIVTGNPAAAIVGVITSAVSAAAVTAFVII